MKLTLSPPLRSAFTLIEIVIALGIFAFAIVGVVFLLGTGLQSSFETQRDTALSSALQTSTAVLRSYDNSVETSTLYFSKEGSLVTSANDAYYRFTMKSVGAAGAPGNIDFWTIETAAQPPAYVPTGRFLTSRLRR